MGTLSGSWAAQHSTAQTISNDLMFACCKRVCIALQRTQKAANQFISDTLVKISFGSHSLFSIILHLKTSLHFSSLQSCLILHLISDLDTSATKSLLLHFLCLRHYLLQIWFGILLDSWLLQEDYFSSRTFCISVCLSYHCVRAFLSYATRFLINPYQWCP